MVMIQVTEKENEEVKEFRKTLRTKIEDRKEDTCTKFGCIVASGILDAGGRNCTIALHKQRHPLKKNIAGLFLFTQYWYWFPLSLMLSLALTPTCIIGLNGAMQMPKYKFTSNAAPSRFAVPQSVKVLYEKVKEAKAGQKAVLSTTAKVSEYRTKRRMTATASFGGDESPSKADEEAKKAEEAKKEAEKKEKEDKEKEEKEKEEVTSEVLENPARVTMSQVSVLSHTLDERYRPLKPNPIGVVMLSDTKPSEPVEEVQISRDDNEVKPPEPFEWP